MARARKSRSKFPTLDFIGWDGEGINKKPDIDEWTDRQVYALLAVSSGETLYDPNGISLIDRLHFIKKIAQAHPNKIHCFYGGSYDFNKILEGLPKEIIEKLHRRKFYTRWRDDNGDYWIFRYRPRKELCIGHLKKGWREIWEEGKSYRDCCDSFIRLWDVIGFFQKSFLSTVKQWLGEDYKDFDLIMAGKKARLSFNESDREFMIRYNRAEVIALVEIMRRLHRQFVKLGLFIKRWDGAGAVAAAVFQEHNLKLAYHFRNANNQLVKIELPEELQIATEYAYFGGRIESGRIGLHKGKIYCSDINSAYPFAAAQLPDINQGIFKHHKRNLTYEKIKDFHQISLVRIRWYFHEKRTYYPFPFRCAGGGVIFPKEGERWVFLPEVLAGIETKSKFDRIEILEAFEFKYTTPNPSSPFAIIEVLYKERQELLKKKDPAEYVLKLAINAIYGKLCQKAGWNQKEKLSPVYHFLLFAGFITSLTRARIYQIVGRNQNSVVSINTDGIVSTKPLKIEYSKNKEFGGWSLEEYDRLVQLQSGVYWLHKENKWSEKARGLGRVIGEGLTEKERNEDRNRQIEIRVNRVLKGWKDKVKQIYFDVKLFITSQKALTGPDWWPRLGHWFQMHTIEDGVTMIGRALQLRCTNWGKRRLPADAKGMHLKLVETEAACNVEYPECGMGEIYSLPWKNGGQTYEYEIDDEDVA